MKPKIYTASKPHHAPKWRELRAKGYNIIATWIDYADGAAASDWQKLWLDCAAEAAAANVTLMYVEDGDQIRGAYVEMGIAIANHRRVFVVKPANLKFTDAVHHPLVTEFEELEDALKAIERLEHRALVSAAA